MSDTPPLLTDRAVLGRNRARADEFFIQDAAADEVQERLIEINRPFTDVAIVTGFPEIWSHRFPDATIVADDDTLALTEASFDLVIHALALHWANDPVGQLVQARRALRPDGLLIATLFAGQTLNELRTSLAEAESRITGGLSPRIAPMGEVRDLGGLLQRAGLALPVADVTPFNVSYQNAFHLMHDLRRMGEANALNGRLRKFTSRNVMTEAASIYAENFGDDEGRITATYEVITLTGWAPAADQPKALRPGSATTRLADALGTTEATIKPNDS